MVHGSGLGTAADDLAVGTPGMVFSNESFRLDTKSDLNSISECTEILDNSFKSGLGCTIQDYELICFTVSEVTVGSKSQYERHFMAE